MELGVISFIYTYANTSYATATYRSLTCAN